MIALILPCIQKKQADTRDHIVSILMENWPLTTKTIYSLLTKRHGQSLTYQAVHKTVKQLLQQGIVVHYNKKYYLNSEWIQQVKKFVLNFEENYQKLAVAKDFAQEEKILQTLDKEEILNNKPTG
jgi:predicted transcriptional regulator